MSSTFSLLILLEIKSLKSSGALLHFCITLFNSSFSSKVSKEKSTKLFSILLSLSRSFSSSLPSLFVKNRIIGISIFLIKWSNFCKEFLFDSSIFILDMQNQIQFKHLQFSFLKCFIIFSRLLSDLLYSKNLKSEYFSLLYVIKFPILLLSIYFS